MATRYELKTFQDIYTAVMEEMKIQSSDTTSLNRVKRLINMVYLDEVIPFKQWRWNRGKITLPKEPYFNTGTANVTQYGTTVTLSSAPGPSKTGYYFSVDGQTEIYRIQSHTAGSATVNLETPFIGATNTASSFKIWTDAVPLPVDCESTFQVRNDYFDRPMDGKGLQMLEELAQPEPKAEGIPLYYSTDDYVDPNQYSTISGLPALSTRASDNQIKTLVFASDVSSYLSEGDRIQITGAGYYAYNGEFIVSSVSTTTLQYTGPITYNESATSDTGLTVKLLNVEGSSERYKELRVYPALYSQRLNLKIDYQKQVPPLVDDSDQPIIPMGHRIVLFYGALMFAWSQIGRNPEEAQRNATLFERKLTKMAAEFDDSIDLAQMKPDMTYLQVKRNQGRTRDTRKYWGGFEGFGGAAPASSTSVTGLANSVAIFDNSSNLQGSTTISTTELGYLDGVTSNIQTQINDINTLADGKILVGNSSNVATEVTPSGDVTISDTGVTAITAGVIVDADISSSAAITRSKLASGTASHVVINDGTGALSSEAQLAKSRGGAGADMSSVTFPSSGAIATTSNKLSAFAATTSAELAGVISDETGSGALVFATSPTLVTPTLGVATATSINKMAITTPATSSTLAVADGKTATISNTLTFSGTDGSSVAFGTGGTVSYLGTAVQADQETGSSTTKAVVPGVQQYHPSAAKAWVQFNTVTSTSITTSYNITSLTDAGTGHTTVVIATDFSSANYCAVGMSKDNGSGTGSIIETSGSKAAGNFDVLTATPSTLALADSADANIVMFGDQ